MRLKACPWPPSGARQKPFPANAVVCLSDRGFVNDEAQLPAPNPRHPSDVLTPSEGVAPPKNIIHLRTLHDWTQPFSAAPPNLARHNSSSGGDGCACLRPGLRRLSGSRRDKPECLRLSHGAPLLRRPREKREDDFHLRPTPTLDLHQLSVPPRRILAVLVSTTPSGTANRHLIPRHACPGGPTTRRSPGAT